MEASLERNISNPHRGSRDKRSRDGCIICRLRKKNCSGPLVAESITCQECIALNVICLGFPGQRPKGMQKNKEKVKELKEKIKDWTSKRSNRNHGVEPLNLSEYSFLVSHASDISGPSSAAPASVNSDFGGLRTSISQEFMHPIATPEAFSHAESSFGSPGLHRSLSDASRPHRPALRLDPVFQQSAGARPAPYPQQGINNHNDTNFLLSPHSGVHRHQRSRSLSSMPRVHLFDNQPENIPQFQLTHQRGTASMDSRQHTLHPGSFGTSPTSADSSIHSPIPQLLVSPAEAANGSTSEFPAWRSHSSGPNSPLSSPSMFGSPGSVFSDLDDPIIPLSGPYSTIPDQPPPVSPYAQQSIHQPTGSLTEGVVFGNDSSLLILGGPHPGLGAPHTLTSASTPNPPAPLPDVYLGEQPSSIPAGSPSSHGQVEGGVGFDLSVLNLGVDAGDSVNEPTYSVPSTGHNDTLIHVGMPTDLVGINYDDTYNNFAQISAGAFGPGEQELVSAFLNLLPDGNDEPHHLHLMPNT